MNKNMEIYALIPARDGSKGVPKKNIALLGGYPLLAYSIVAAKLAKTINRVIVSTDSEEIAEIARKYGAETPFLRPAEFASDTAKDYDVLKHACDWFQEHEGGISGHLVYLRPTTPLRTSALIDSAIEKLIGSNEATSLRSAHETAESAYKYFKIENNFFTGLFPDFPAKEYFDLPRQMLPATYHPNGYVDIVKTKLLMESGSCFGNKILAFVTPMVTEIDCWEDFEYLTFQFKKEDHPLNQYLKENYPPHN